MLLNPNLRTHALGPQSGRRMNLGAAGSSGPPPPRLSGPSRSWEEGFRMREITPAEWEGRRELFTRLYFTEDRRLDEVRRIMANDHGFYANDTQCKKKIKKWDLGKNLNKVVASAMLRIQKRRLAKGKATVFTYKGHKVNQEKLERSRRRLRGWEDEGETVADMPVGVTYSTPKPIPDDPEDEDSEYEGPEDEDPEDEDFRLRTPGSGFSPTLGGYPDPHPPSSPGTLSDTGTIGSRMGPFSNGPGTNLYLQTHRNRNTFSESPQPGLTQHATTSESPSSPATTIEPPQLDLPGPESFFGDDERASQTSPTSNPESGALLVDPVIVTGLLSAYLRYPDRESLKHAEKIQRLALENLKGNAGETHPDTLVSMHNLALMCRDQGKYKDADEIFSRTIRLSSGICQSHPHWMRPKHGVGVVYIHQGRWREAEAVISQVAEASKYYLGGNHPDTLSAIHSLATVYMEIGKFREAEYLLAGPGGAWEMSRNSSGLQHPETLATMRTLATAYLNQGHLRRAERMLELVLRISEHALGEIHRQTITSRHCLGVAYLDLKEWEKAEETLTAVVNLSKQYLGGDYRHTLTAMHNLGVTYLDQGKLGLAKDQFVEVVGLSSRHMGDNHPDTLSSKNKLAKTYLKLKCWDDAQAISQEVVGKSRKVLGETHPDVYQYSALLVSINQERNRAL